ncbi:MAG: hypothetical protein M1144_00980 [Candidatus Thermoplasmatota archaeon]|jgi:hypothetical protein|nr:hypothetical protein [Candidatus Thermoplasmatota archaeon]
MDTIGLFLSVLLAGLSAVLAGLGLMVAARYEDRRILFISIAFLILAVVGALSVFSDLSPLYGGSFAVEPVPLLLLVLAVGLLYVSLIQSRPQSPGKPHG